MPLNSRNIIADGSWVLQKVEDPSLFKSFDCADSDLNDYYHSEVQSYKTSLLTQTYYLQNIEYPGVIFALLDLCNDAVRIDKYKSVVKIDPLKQHASLPAVKLTRLGVQKEYQRSDVGTQVLNMIKRFFITDNRTGCRFITVDAYNNPWVLAFYGKSDFQLFWDSDKNKKTRSMFFDLIRLSI